MNQNTTSNKAPAFQLYADDLIAGTLKFSDAELGLFMRLLCAQWSEGSLPDDDEELASYGKNPTPLARVKAKFAKGADGRLRNARLERVRQEQLEFRARMAERGRAGAEARWHKPGTAVAAPVISAGEESAGPNGRADLGRRDGLESERGGAGRRAMEGVWNGPAASPVPAWGRPGTGALRSGGEVAAGTVAGGGPDIFGPSLGAGVAQAMPGQSRGNARDLPADGSPVSSLQSPSPAPAPVPATKRLDRNFVGGTGGPTKSIKLDAKRKEVADRLEAALGVLWVNDAGKWVNRVKSNLLTCERVVAEVESAAREGRIQTDAARYTEQIWKEFAT